MQKMGNPRAIAGIIGVGAVFGLTLTSASAAFAADPPPYNQDGISSSFQVACYFTTTYDGDPIQIPDNSDEGSHDADLSNPDDVAFLRANAPDFYQDAMERTGDTAYPFPVDVEVSVGTEATNRLPENPMPGQTYAGPFASALDLVLPATVADVITYNNADSLSGVVRANASLQGDGTSGTWVSPLTSDDFSLSGSGEAIPVDAVAPIVLETVGLWRDAVVSADWSSDTLSVIFAGDSAVSVSVVAFDGEDNDPSYDLNLTCFPTADGGATSTVVNVGDLYGNYVAPTTPAPSTPATKTPALANTGAESSIAPFAAAALLLLGGGLLVARRRRNNA